MIHWDTLVNLDCSIVTLVQVLILRIAEKFLLQEADDIGNTIATFKRVYKFGYTFLLIIIFKSSKVKFSFLFIAQFLATIISEYNALAFIENNS